MYLEIRNADEGLLTLLHILLWDAPNLITAIPKRELTLPDAQIELGAVFAGKSVMQQ